mmetsp:Transcript_83468/g.241550  ORF Transcript_83468/g.241550 Transcript_83468/m.241550 type:complete len:292 (-) Transcript_83468:62-937(-)
MRHFRHAAALDASCEGRPLAQLRLRLHIASMELRDALRDRKAQADALEVPRILGILLFEGLEDSLQRFARDACARVCDAELDEAMLRIVGRVDGDPALGGELARICCEVVQHLGEFRGVPMHDRQALVSDAAHQLDTRLQEGLPCLVHSGLGHGRDLPNDLQHVHRVLRQRGKLPLVLLHAALKLGRILHHIVHQVQKAICAALDHAELFLLHLVRSGLRHRRGEPQDTMQRAPKLMGDDGLETRLALLERLLRYVVGQVLSNNDNAGCIRAQLHDEAREDRHVLNSVLAA